MKKDKAFSIITIICFATVVLIPLALAFMWFFTGWKKKTKLLLSSILGPLYVLIVVLLLFLHTSVNQNGISTSLSYNQGYTNFESEISTDKKDKRNLENPYKTESNKKGKSENAVDSERLPKTLQKNKGSGGSRWILPIFFFLFMLILILWTNWRAAKKKTGYENPYVDTNLYKLPLEDNSKIPMVHYLRLKLNQNEKLIYATETTMKDNEGDFIVTNQRVVMFQKSENQEFPLQALTAVASVSNSAMVLTSGDRKYYVLLPESQLKYALAAVRWAYAQATK